MVLKSIVKKILGGDNSFILFLFHTHKIRKGFSLHPIIISKEEVKKTTVFFDNVVNNIVNQVNSYQELYTNLNVNYGTKALSNYFIIKNSIDWLGPIATIPNETKKVYRLIKKESVDDFISLYKTGVLQVLEKNHLIPHFIISNYYLDDYPIVIEIDKIQINNNYLLLSHNEKLSGFLLCVIIKRLCEKFGIGLQDPHIRQVSITDSGPLYFDFGSFEYNVLYEDDYPMISSFAYSLLFDYFPNSIFNRYNKYPAVIDIADPYKHYEANMLLLRYYRYHLKHSSSIVKRIIRNIFIRRKCEPFEVFLLFRDEMNIDDLFLKFLDK